MPPNKGEDVTVHKTKQGRCSKCYEWLDLDKTGRIPVHEIHQRRWFITICNGTGSLPISTREQHKIEYKEDK